MPLPEYLAAAAGKPFARGSADCCIFVADWVLDQTGVDPAQGFRGYATDTGAMLRIGRAGGFLSLIEGAMLAGGFKRTEAPKAGDVAIIKAASTSRKAIYSTAIKTDHGWACKEGEGVTISQAESVMIWSI